MFEIFFQQPQNFNITSPMPVMDITFIGSVIVAILLLLLFYYLLKLLGFR